MNLVKRIFFMTILSSSFLFCKSREFNIGESNPNSVWPEPGDELRTPDKITYAFHWNKEPIARSQPQYVVRNLLRQGEQRLQDGNAAGSGLYVANDPFSSVAYGNTLIVIPVLPKTAVKVAHNPVTVADIRSQNPILMYAFNGKMFLESNSIGRSNYAAVMRGESSVDFEKVFSISLDKTKCGTRFPRGQRLKQGQNWREYLETNTIVLCPDRTCEDPQFKLWCSAQGDLDLKLYVIRNRLAHGWTEEGSFFETWLELDSGKFVLETIGDTADKLNDSEFCANGSSSECFIALMKEIRFGSTTPLKRTQVFDALKKVGFATGDEARSPDEWKVLGSSVRARFCKIDSAPCTVDGFRLLFTKRFGDNLTNLRENDTQRYAQDEVLRAIVSESMTSWKKLN